MIRSMTLDRFKNFAKAQLPLGPFTLLVGTNASGKSNIRDAFRFVHGVSRGYTLAEIIGEKWIEGGVLQWKGIRGGTREATFQSSATFAIELGFDVPEGSLIREGAYRIEVAVAGESGVPRVTSERLLVSG